MKRIHQFLASKLKIYSMDPDEARIEYAFKLNLLLMIAISAISAFLSIIGYIFSIILLDTFYIMFFIFLLFIITWFLSGKRNWKWTRIVPVGTIFLVAVYGNFIGGIGAPAILIYTLSILLASQLYGKRIHYITIFASITAFTVIAVLHKNSLIPAPRIEAQAYQNRMLVVILLTLSIGILLRFIISQLEKAVKVSRDREQELTVINEELMAANEEFEAQNEELIDLNRELEKSEYNFRKLFESSPVPVTLLRNDTILLANKAFIKMTGTDSAGHLTDSALIDFIAPEDRDKINKHMKEQQYDKDAPVNFEITVNRIDGTTLICDINVSSVIMDDGQATLLFANDITARKNTENALREQEQTQRSILEAAPVGIALLVDRRFTRVNPSFCKMTGYTEEEVMGQLTKIIYRDDETYEKKGKEIYEDMMKNGTGTMEMPMRRKNGELFYALLSLSPSNPGDFSAGVCATALDITERKTAEAEKDRMQKQLLQAQKMEAVGTLTGGIAHDFNNMLTGIMGSLGMVEIMLKKEKDPDLGILKKYIITAQEASNRAADMTKQLLTISRKSELKLTPVDINFSLNNIKKLCQSSFPKSVALDFHIGKEPLFIHAEPVQIEQVLLNLCLNASHAMTFMRSEGERQGGTLSVSAIEKKCDEICCAQHQDASPDVTYIMIQVTDTGIGINEEARSQIFTPFFTTKRKHQGTGLGLAMVYNIINQHGGFIDVYSEPDKGTSFNIYLPKRKEKTSNKIKKTDKPDIVTGNGTILVIDDEKAILKIARAMLRECGYHVLTAEDGTGGVEIYRREHGSIDGVLLDLSMPKMSGIEVFKHLQTINSAVKVLITSGFMEEEEIEKALSLGINGFLPKPYSTEELSKEIKKALES